MKPITFSRITPATVLKFCFGLLLGVLILGYTLFQARNLLMGPSLVLTNEPDQVQTSRTIILEGVAKNIVAISVNGREIHTDETGVFSEELVLESGYTIMTLRAEDRYGRTSTLSRKFVYLNENQNTEPKS